MLLALHTWYRHPTRIPLQYFCYLPSVCGNCKALFVRFFYNVSSQQCEEFIYGGCGGNRNNFETKGECFQACSHVGIQPPGLAAVGAAASGRRPSPQGSRAGGHGSPRDARQPQRAGALPVGSM
nr:PREDICTED: kunitz-type protease inhibitor 4 [Apteryx mantelli mantelli]